MKEILDTLPPLFNIDEVLKKHPLSYTDSVSSVLYQEVVSYNKLLKIITETCNLTFQCLKGLITITPDVEEFVSEVYFDMLPKQWKTASYLSKKPLGSYVSDLLTRLSFIQSWINNGAPKVFWLSGFFHPRKFLTAILQRYSRKHSQPMDSVTFISEILTDDQTTLLLGNTSLKEDTNSDVCYIRGLYLEGARWDSELRTLEEATPKELFAPMPIVCLRPKSIDSQKDLEKNNYPCPVYITPDRDGILTSTGLSNNYVCSIDLPTSKPEKHWIKRGAALFCSLGA